MKLVESTGVELEGMCGICRSVVGLSGIHRGGSAGVESAEVESAERESAGVEYTRLKRRFV